MTPRRWTGLWSTTSSSSPAVKPSVAGENFKRWVTGFLTKINDLHLEVLESFQNADGSRVASRWLLTGKNNGFAGTAPDQQDISMTGTAVWAVREDGQLLSNHVERAALEQLQRLSRST
jgi:SnoaL-like polyketide cyclase